MSQEELGRFVSIEYPCPDCDDSFDGDMGVRVHHAKKHDGRLSRPRVECSQCGVEKRVTRYEKRVLTNHFCDVKCKGDWQNENWHGGSQTAMRVCEICGKFDLLKQADRSKNNRWCSVECAIQGLAISQRKKIGILSTRTLDTIRYSLGDGNWKNIASEVRRRANHVCAMCGTSSEQIQETLNVHHIIPLRCGGSNHADNLLALCRSCHATAEVYTTKFTEPVLTHEHYQPENTSKRPNRPDEN